MPPLPTPDGLDFFDPSAETAVTTGRLPHWAQAGVVTFLTFRTWDSIPRAVLISWLAERVGWLHARGIDPTRKGWQEEVGRQSPAVARAYRKFVAERWESVLDDGHGECPLRDPALASVVAGGLRHFDGVRYDLFDFVVMPNHVHVLAAFPDPHRMPQQCESWKRFTATRVNGLLRRRGRFWESESFDHLVRTAEQFHRLRRYIAENPMKARLRAGEYVHYSRPLGSIHPGSEPRPLAERADHTQE